MSAQIIDGRQISSEIKQELKEEISAFFAQNHYRPGLAVIKVGDDPASAVYVRNKKQACEEVGIISESHDLPESTQQNELINLIESLNQKPDIHGILVQLPLPAHIDEKTILERIDPLKDVDGFHPFNVGRLAQRRPHLEPCTPLGVMQLIKRIGVDPKGMDVVIVGASNIVGRPMALELLIAGATVTVAHRFTKDLASHVKRAQLLVVACGIPHLIKGEWIQEGAVVIDVGINRMEDGKLVGDVEFDVAKERAKAITPVPGGVGPMTVAMLMHNTFVACKKIQAKG